MSDESQPTPPGKDPTPPRRGQDRRPERQPSSNLFWYLMIGLLLACVLFSVMSEDQFRKETKFSEFLAAVEGGSNEIHEVEIGPQTITYQSKPNDEKTKATPEGTKKFKVHRIGLDGNGELMQRLEKGLKAANIDVDGADPPTPWQTLAPLLILPILFVLVLLFVMRRMGGAGTAMSFGRSRGKLYAQEDVHITFNEVAGIEEAVEELREVVEFLRSPEKYHALGGRIPRGVLLVGPPGTGKTLLAKAVAGEAGVGFFSLSGSDFVEMFVGVGAARVRDMFQQAAAKSPAIIFIDELDALGKVRGSGLPGGHDEREQTLNALLVEMDGFSSDQSVIVMGATNRPETLDPALMRPGRFDRHVLVDRPDVKGREAILKVHAAKIKMDDTVDLHHLAKITPGFVGADLANLVNEGALLAARKDKNRVGMTECEEAVERVVAGLEKANRIIVEEVKQRVAYHECGHALVACSLPHADPVHKISIIPRGMGALGYTMHRPTDDRQLVTQSELENRIACLLGGIAAEKIVYDETSTGAQNDLERATDIARRMVTEFGMSPTLGRMHYSETKTSPFLAGATTGGDVSHSGATVREIDLEVKRIIDEQYDTAVEILSERRDVLEHMTKDLIDVETMDANHLAKILDEHDSGPRIKPGTFVGPKSKPAEPTTSTAEEDEGPTRESADGA